MSFAKMLNDMVGVNVRQPSSNVPPFRAQQWSYDVGASLAGGASATFPVFFRNGSTVVGSGIRGVLSSLDFYIAPMDTDVLLINVSAITATLLKRDQVVPGFEFMSPGALTMETITDATGSDSYGSDFPGQKVVVPVKLEEGDTLDFNWTNGFASAASIRVVFAGWFYPIETQGENVVGTVADRGSETGLART